MSKLLYRRCAAEFVGTFCIVVAPVAWSAAPAAESGGILAAALVSGLAVTAMIASFGPVSAAHFNPAVTLGFASARRFPKHVVAPYILAQLAGAVAAAECAVLLSGHAGGTHIPSIAIGRAIGVEALLTFMLMLVIMAVATDKRVDGTLPALAIGLTVVMDVLIGGALTGGSMNPVRSAGPALLAGGAALANLWVYIVGPVIGAVLAALVTEAIRGHSAHVKSAPAEW